MESKELAQAIAEALHQKNGKAPWWAKDFRIMGPLVAIALALVAQNAGLIPSPFKEQHKEIADKLDETNAILMTMCERTAESEWGRAACRTGSISFSNVEDSKPIFPTVFADDTGGNP